MNDTFSKELNVGSAKVGPSSSGLGPTHVSSISNARSYLSIFLLQLLAKASSLEAVKLLGDAIKQRSDHAVMTEVARAVDVSLATNPKSQALKAYRFLFKCYMRAFKTTLITPAKPSEYPYLIQHLLQLPKLQQPDNLLVVADNLKILLAPSVRVDTATILKIANLKLSMVLK